jgi:NAD-dependent deacetylase
MRIDLDDRSRVLVLTGAGISAESGVPTFRDANGLWEGHDVTQVASPEGFAADPELGWRFYSERRAAMVRVVPNAGHRALVALEDRLGDRFLLATQNIDGLHAAAGSQRVVEMHGNLMRTKCWRCARTPFADTGEYYDRLPVCRECRRGDDAALLRPDVVWFGEMLPEDAMRRILAFMSAAGRDLVFLAIGTSGVVYPAAGLVEVTKKVGGTTWLVNLEPPDNAGSFDHVVLGPAGRELPALLG